MITRRFFVGGLIAAPAIVSVRNLMPVRRMVSIDIETGGPWIVVYGRDADGKEVVERIPYIGGGYHMTGHQPFRTIDSIQFAGSRA